MRRRTVKQLRRAILFDGKRVAVEQQLKVLVADVLRACDIDATLNTYDVVKLLQDELAQEGY